MALNPIQERAFERVLKEHKEALDLLSDYNEPPSLTEQRRI